MASGELPRGSPPPRTIDDMLELRHEMLGARHPPDIGIQEPIAETYSPTEPPVGEPHVPLSQDYAPKFST